MWMPDSPEESAKARHKRLFDARKNKAKVLNERVNHFIDDITTSTIFKDSEKRAILELLKFKFKM
jgi:hypothetical protein